MSCTVFCSQQCRDRDNVTSDNATMQQRYNATTLLVPDKIGKNVHPSESQWSCDTNLSNNMTGDNCLVLEQRVCPAPVYCKKKKTLLVLLGNVVQPTMESKLLQTFFIFYGYIIYTVLSQRFWSSHHFTTVYTVKQHNHGYQYIFT